MRFSFVERKSHWKPELNQGAFSESMSGLSRIKKNNSLVVSLQMRSTGGLTNRRV